MDFENNNQQTDNNLDLLDEEFLNFKNIFREFENDLLNYALHYAKIGYPVFPLHNLVKEKRVLRCTCRDWKFCDKQGKHPRTQNGFKSATLDENQIIAWWEKYPDANIGILTGIESGIFVLDIDVKYGGEYSLEELRDIHRENCKESNAVYQPLPATLTTITGSGGRHLYFKYPLDFKKLKGSVSKIGDGLDVRANGNYIIAPPSNHISGNKYQWFGVNILIEDAPNWLIYEMLKMSAGKTTTPKSSEKHFPKTDDGKKISKGERQDYLFRYICGLVKSFPVEEVRKRAMTFNEKRLDPAFSEREVDYHVNYLYGRYGKLKNKKNPESEIPLAE